MAGVFQKKESMNKQEKIIVGILVVALFASLYVMNQDAKRMTEYRRTHPLPQAQAVTNAPTALPPGDAFITATETQLPSTEPDVPVTPPASALPERRFTLSNEVSVVTLTSKGGGIKDATLLGYNSTVDPSDGLVKLNFSDSPSMSIEGIAGLGKEADFEIEVLDDARSALITADSGTGLKFERRVFLTNGYNIAVSDALRNDTDVAVSIPSHKVALGPMVLNDENSTDADLAVNVYASENGKRDVVEINRNTKNKGFGSQFGTTGGGCSVAKVSPTAPVTAAATHNAETYWLTARGRFFVQVLTPGTPSPAFETRALRDAAAPAGSLSIKQVSAALVSKEQVVEPGGSLEQTYSLFIGPRKMSELRKLGPMYTEIMNFGTWAIFCRALLDLLNFLYKLVPNYGIAIILLTVLVRLLLYPVNKRNAESMRKMAEIQPMLKEVQAKHKDDPEKLRAETMRIYGENKVNPLASCLPMLIQLPIFFALFTVLRSAVELRNAPFLWINDLSSPENLFRGQLGFGLNILPIAMALTMALQSSLTPSTGDRQQQKMMMIMMPAMMLLICYNFASALSLYWTVSQALAIFGLLWSRRKRRLAAAAAGGVEVMPERETRQMRRDKERRAGNKQ